MKVQGKIFKSYIGHFYIRSIFHGVIGSQSVNVRQTVSIKVLSFSPGHFLVNDYSTVTEQLAIRFQQNFTCILMGSVRIAVQNFIDLTVDLNLSRSQLYKITLWAISRFLLDKLLLNFNTM